VRSLATDVTAKKTNLIEVSLKPPLDEFSTVESINCFKFRVF